MAFSIRRGFLQAFVPITMGEYRSGYALAITRPLTKPTRQPSNVVRKPPSNIRHAIVRAYAAMMPRMTCAVVSNSRTSVVIARSRKISR